ncbi:ABC transporter ATP-binding protein, partial [Nocardiopsis tropica]|nr:ABC transporter ATP-binding protein [Nocardiopsis tropica]
MVRSASPSPQGTAGTPAPATSTLSVRGVHKSYGHHRVLRGADLELPPGCLGGVVGENGAGKSTLL